MASPSDSISMALFCDFENVALGVRDAQYEKFDIKPILERLLLKGSIVVKKAYCDWERYKGFKATMHEANFELIEIPHVRQSGKNSADIRLVVDALDLCYTKSHVNTFVIISGDSDFSPLVSKLRENNKQVIGVGVKQSTSDLLIANCDEFIFYDDLVRDSQRQSAMRRDGRDQPQPRRSPEEEAKRKADMDKRRTKAVEMAAETYEALVTDRDEGGRILCGGARPQGGYYEQGSYYLPTVIEGLPNSARMCREEIFGPVLALLPWSDEADLIAQCNDNDYGLASGIWTRDYKAAWRIGRALQTGTVWINTYKLFSVSTPFGGVKLSGTGREKGRQGILEYTTQKSFYWGMNTAPMAWAAS